MSQTTLNEKKKPSPPIATSKEYTHYFLSGDNFSKILNQDCFVGQAIRSFEVESKSI